MPTNRVGYTLVLQAFHIQRGIILDAALWVLCRCRHKTHWTKHAQRLDRDFGRKSWGDEGYSRGEFVAELGSTFLSPTRRSGQIR